MLQLTIRLVFSLAVVLGLLLLLARLGSRRFRGQQGALVRVVHRQALTRTTSVSVVAVGSRVLVLGTTEHQVRVLAELDPDELDATDLAALGSSTQHLHLAQPPTPVPARRAGAHRADAPPAPQAALHDGALAGSVLSVHTWRQALSAATRRAS